jgi:diaminohydroxyphosphoribosylaminopyrimidine deaminase / 5-amino-6-(5-phosphoribosylamino)uracil reductase
VIDVVNYQIPNQMSDRHWMSACLELARQGKTAPNPQVGSVIVKDGILIGSGFHPQVGQPHAEIFALRSAELNNRQAIAGATLYVNLEPCNHFGRTPPCTEAIIAAKIKRVVVGMIDPNPLVSGQGCDRLRQAGIEVTTGILEPECQELNEGFSHRQRYGLPFGILKYAITLDGKIASNTGHSQWITNPRSRQAVHHLRANCDAIIVGGNTVRKDNPYLTTHGVSSFQPLRVVMSQSLDLPQDAHLWDQVSDQVSDQEISKTLVFTQVGQNLAMQTYLRDRHIEVFELDQLTPKSVMQELANRGCNQVLWECGGNLAASAIADRVVQKIYAFIAPKIIGGNLAPGAIADLGINQMTEAINLSRITIKTYDQDIAVIGYLE